MKKSLFAAILFFLPATAMSDTLSFVVSDGRLNRGNWCHRTAGSGSLLAHESSCSEYDSILSQLNQIRISVTHHRMNLEFAFPDDPSQLLSDIITHLETFTAIRKSLYIHDHFLNNRVTEYYKQLGYLIDCFLIDFGDDVGFLATDIEQYLTANTEEREDFENDFNNRSKILTLLTQHLTEKEHLTKLTMIASDLVSIQEKIQ